MLTKKQASALARIATGLRNGEKFQTHEDIRELLHLEGRLDEDVYTVRDGHVRKLTEHGWKLLTEYQQENENVTDN